MVRPSIYFYLYMLGKYRWAENEIKKGKKTKPYYSLTHFFLLTDLISDAVEDEKHTENVEFEINREIGSQLKS